MVEHRVACGKEEAEHFYDIPDNEAVNREQVTLDHAMISVGKAG